ncbi:hypothetical protein HDV06_005592 [Boothiomyces sp. JEL0866]|nr:hypothetical protein HDV06_005592 [Boothiomyces sp. JEL0866]
MPKEFTDLAVATANHYALPSPLNPPAKIKTAKPVPDYIDPTDPLAVGIFYHELNEFEISAYYFSVAAARGHPTGLFLYAISLRHGWGVEKNEKEAFRLLSSVTESVVGEEDFKRMGNASHIPLALYEVGMSFQQGWGVPKDKVKAAYYFQQAAQLGDADAQVALAECFMRLLLSNYRGDGVKPSKQHAATWFRKAEKQGARLVQMQWIWKEKYDEK